MGNGHKTKQEKVLVRLRKIWAGGPLKFIVNQLFHPIQHDSKHDDNSALVYKLIYT